MPASPPAPEIGPSAVVAADSRTHRRGPKRAKYWIALAVLLLLAAAVLLPPTININRYQRRITQSISGALGRPVNISSAKLVMLPRPGFELSDFVVEEDPAFGAEPILRSGTVVASVRLLSLWRGRLEIARIRLEEPSLNLTRNAAGQWNFAGVLVQASRLSNAPTAQKHASGAPRFPYIEASGARINFKHGYEKLPFSFVDADLSVWLASPDQWQLRVEAAPVRTDLDLDFGGTGLVRVSGSLQRAPSLDKMPLNLTAQWSGGSMGQLGRLLLGHDPGWRGNIDLRASVHGALDDAAVKATVRASGIHRSEFEPDRTLALDTTCEMHYRHALESVEGLTCVTPVGDGQLVLTGAVGGVASAPRPALSLRIENAQASELALGLQTMRAGFPPGISVEGPVNGQFAYDPSQPEPFTGKATAAILKIASDGLKQPLIFRDVALTAVPYGDAGTSTPVLRASRGVAHARAGKSRGITRMPSRDLVPAVATQPTLVLSPLALEAAGDPALMLGWSFTTEGFQLHLAGSAPVDRLATLNRSFRLLPLSAESFGPEGTADVDLTVRSPWLLPISAGGESAGGSGELAEAIPAGPGGAFGGGALSARRIDGTLRLRATRLSISFLPAPVEVTAADAVLSGDQVDWQHIAFGFGTIRAEGALRAPLFCSPQDSCVRHFDLHLATLDLARLQSTLLGERRGQLLAEILPPLRGRTGPWPRFAGSLHIDTLSLNGGGTASLTLHNAAASLEASGDALTIDSLAAEVLGGRLQASGTVHETGGMPDYALQLAMKDVDARQAAALFHEDWGGGTINLASQLRLSGVTAAELAGSAAGSFRVDWTGHASAALPDSGNGSATDPARDAALIRSFDEWSGSGVVADRTLKLDRSFIGLAERSRGRTPRKALKAPASSIATVNETGAGTQVAPPGGVLLTGTISFDRQLALQAGEAPASVRIGGTFQHPTLPTTLSAPASSRFGRATPQR